MGLLLLDHDMVLGLKITSENIISLVSSKPFDPTKDLFTSPPGFYELPDNNKKKLASNLTSGATFDHFTMRTSLFIQTTKILY